MLLVMARPVPLHQLIGTRLRQLREGAGLRQEDIATQARAVGFGDWVRGTVAMIEGGRRRVTLEEFLALPLILYYAGVGEVALTDLVGDDAPALINVQTAIASATLRDTLAGRAAHASMGPPPGDPARDTEERQEADRLWKRWARRRSGQLREPEVGVLDAVALEARSDALVSAARQAAVFGGDGITRGDGDLWPAAPGRTGRSRETTGRRGHAGFAHRTSRARACHAGTPG